MILPSSQDGEKKLWYLLTYLKKDVYFFYLEGKEKERGNIECEREAPIGCLLHTSTGEQACDPSTCPDQESNQ